MGESKSERDGGTWLRCGLLYGCRCTKIESLQRKMAKEEDDESDREANLEETINYLRN